MNSTRKQRRDFVLNAKKQYTKGLITKVQFEEIQKQISNMGKAQHDSLQHRLLEGKLMPTNDIDFELVDEDITPDDL